MKTVLFLTIIAAGSLFANGQMEAQDIGTPDMARKVLIATEPTEFKNALVTEIVRQLNDGNTYIKIVNHADKGLEGVDPRQFGAVLISNSGATARVRPWVISFLNRVAAYDDNVVLHTTQITVWTPPVQVDSVTSPSDMNRIRPIATGLVNKVKALL